MSYKPLVSIIIPIYKVEKYIERCINSILNQTYQNLEIILVDDGSPDGCPVICDKWSLKDNRIKVIHKKNEGLGKARNSGLDIATGEYILFVDSDDYVSEKLVETSVYAAIKENAEIVCFGFSSIGIAGEIKKNYIPKTKKKTYRHQEIKDVFLADLIAPNSKTGEVTNLIMSAWATMISNRIIQKYNWRFVSEREYISEDLYSLLQLYSYVNSVTVVSEPLYFYCENAGSLTQTYRSDRFEKIIKFYQDAIALCRELQYSDKIKERLDYSLVSNTIGTMKTLCKSKISVREKYRELKIIINNSVLQNMLNRPHIYNAESKPRKIIIKLINKKSYILCMLLTCIQNKFEKM